MQRFSREKHLAALLFAVHFIVLSHDLLHSLIKENHLTKVLFLASANQFNLSLLYPADINFLLLIILEASPA